MRKARLLKTQYAVIAARREVRLACGAAAAVMTASLFVSAPATGGILNSPWDLVAHAVFYGTLAALLACAAGRSKLLAAWLLTCAIGLADEAYQWMLPTRHADAMDFMVDVMSAALVITAARWIRLPGSGGSVH